MAHERNIMELEQYLAKGFKKQIKGKLDTAFRRKRKHLKFGIITSKIKKKRNKKKLRKQRLYLNRIPRSYKTYIQSPYWEKRKSQFYQKFGKICFICKRSYRVHLHHAFYGNYGSEMDSDLVPLCYEHHERLHQIIGKTEKNMRKKTLEALEIMQYEI